MKASVVVSPIVPPTGPTAGGAEDRRSVAPAAALGAGAVAVALLSCAVALLVAGGAPPRGLPAGLADPGPAVGWGLRLVRPLALVAGVLSIGSLLVAAGLGPNDRALRCRCLRLTRRTAAVWSAAGVVGFVLSVCDSLGVPVAGVSIAQLQPWTAAPAALAHLVLALGAAAVAVGTLPTGSSAGARVLLAVALGASLAVPAAGHATGVDDGGASLSGLLVHVVAALVWTGGLAGLLLHLRADRAALTIAVPRFSVLALGAYVALAISGMIALAGTLPLVGPRVGGSLGEWVRRGGRREGGAPRPPRVRRPPAPEADDSAGPDRGAAGLRQAGGSGALADGGRRRSRHGARPDPGAAADHRPSHAGQARSTSSRWCALATSWRPNAVVLVVVTLAVAAYVVAARALYGGERPPWPRRRTSCFVAAAVVAVR